MAFQLFKFAEKSPEQEFKEQAKAELESKKAQTEVKEEKAETAEKFLKTPEAVRVIEEWRKKGYTKRGVVKLLMVLYPMFKSNKSIVSAAKDLLASLKGEDGLSRLLGVLKLVPEGIMK
jgi:hypothetical protein